MNSGIYLISNVANGKLYVGSSENIPNRWCDHIKPLRRGCHPNRYLQNAFNKHGENSFRFDVIEFCELRDYHIDPCGYTDDIRYLTDRETWWVVLLGTLSPKGYNLILPDRSIISNETRLKLSKASQGNQRALGHKHSDEVRRRISETHKGKPKPEEQKRKMSASQKGRPKELSEETRERLVTIRKGKEPWNKGKTGVYSEEMLFRMGKGGKRRIDSEETRRKKSESRKGKTHSLETRAKMSDSQRGRVVSNKTRRKISDALHRRREELEKNQGFVGL
jgi:group I intron endonuclease